MDRITKEHRSWNMSRIRGKNTQPEMTVRKFLYAHGIRYRLHAKLPGRPDITIKKRKVAVFINGCFWHAHNTCPDFRWPKTRSEFWKAKIEGNVQRDKSNHAKLEDAGWRVLVVWECDIKRSTESTLEKLFEDIVTYPQV